MDDTEADNDGGLAILLVEDVDWEARMVEEVLAEAGLRCKLSRAERLAGAIAHVGGNHVDAILLDLSLPDSQGLDTIICMCAVAPLLPIIVLTGQEDEELALEALRCGAQDYLVKGEDDGWTLARAIRLARARKQGEQAVARHKELAGEYAAGPGRE